MIALLSRLRAQASRGFHWFVHDPQAGERAIMLNRIFIAACALAAAHWLARGGDKPAGDYLRGGLPWLAAYVAASACLAGHMIWRPAPSAARRTLAIVMDSSAVALALHHGGAASAYLFPIYYWMVLGNAVRLGAFSMALTVLCAAAGFAAVAATTAFWRDNAALSVALFLSLIVIPAYGGLMLRRLAEARAEAERQPGQDAVAGLGEPRAAHAADGHRRPRRAAAPDASRRGAARHRGDDRRLRRHPAAAYRRAADGGAR